MYNDPLYRLHQAKFRIQLIYEITDGMKNIRKKLLKRHKRLIYSQLFYLFTESLRNFREIKTFLEGLTLVIKLKKISKSLRFWIGFLMKIFYEFLRSSRFSLYLLPFLSRIDAIKSRF